MSTTSTVLFRNFGTLLATVGIVMLANTAFRAKPSFARHGRFAVATAA